VLIRVLISILVLKMFLCMFYKLITATYLTVIVYLFTTKQNWVLVIRYFTLKTYLME